MNTDAAPTTQPPRILGPDGGEHYFFLNHVATVKASGGSNGQLSVVVFVVLDGEIVQQIGDVEERCETGGMALLPRAVPHGFQLVSEERASSTSPVRVLDHPGSTPWWAG